MTPIMLLLIVIGLIVSWLGICVFSAVILSGRISRQEEAQEREL